MAHRDAEHGPPGPRLTRRAYWLLLALAPLAACGRKGELYLPEGQGPARGPEEGDDLPERTDETDNLGER